MAYFSLRPNEITQNAVTFIDKLTPPDPVIGSLLVIGGLVMRRQTALVGGVVAIFGFVSLYKAVQSHTRKVRPALPAGDV